MQTRFLGLSVTAFDVELGRGSQPSSLRVGLVPDPANGDYADVPAIGSPVYFQSGGFAFGGLLQRFGDRRGQAGASVYEAVVVDPREILAGAQVVTEGWSGTVPSTLRNVFNAYGYWEAQGFGLSQLTGAGMPWLLVQRAVLNMANSPTSRAFGGMLEWGGVRYGLDLRELPRVPDFYRVPGGVATLLDLITQVCEDGAHDFFVDLVGLTIRVRTASRSAPAGGMGFVRGLTAAASFAGIVIESDDAAEMTAEPTAALVTGGQKTGVHMADEFYSYWGTDVDGNPVVGEAGTFEDLGACDYAYINPLDCADFLGTTFYTLNTWECRFALWGREAWDAFISRYKPGIAAKLGMAAHGQVQAAGMAFAPQLPVDLVDDRAANVGLAADETKAENQERLYDLVRRTAEEFYGKQYLAVIPAVTGAYDPETGALRTTLEPSPSGYLRFGAAALGVPPARLDVLQEADERVVPFGYFPDISDADTTELNLDETAVDAAGRAWVRGQVSPRIVFLADGRAAVHVRFGSGIFDRKSDDFGDVNLVAKCFAPNVTEAQFNQIVANQFGGALGRLGLHPKARLPEVIGVPLRSNVERYGPWFVSGPPGPVRVEQDDSLTPWDYGGEEAMMAAGTARAAVAAGRNWTGGGNLTVVGAPAFSPGDVVEAGGPCLSGLRVSFGPQGLTTQYRWQNQFTPAYGKMLRQTTERIRQSSLAAVELRRTVRLALNRAAVAAGVKARAARGPVANRAEWQKHQSPHNVLMAKAVQASDGSTRTLAGTETYTSSLKLQQEGGHSAVGMMSLDGLVRAYTTSAASASKLPKQETPDGLGGVTGDDLNFVKAGNDVEVLAWSETYAGAHARKSGNDPANTRPLGLRGPLALVGWGYTQQGQPVPGDGFGNFHSDYLTRSDLWKPGPVDLRWDEWRKVWTAADLMDGRSVTSIAAGATGTIRVGGDAARPLTVRNRWSTAIPANRQVVCAYIANRNEWQVIAADCTS